MKLSLKSLTALFVSMVMILSLFSGCGNTSGKKEDVNAKAVSEATLETKAQGTAKQEKTTLKLLTVSSWWTKGHDAAAAAAAEKIGISLDVEKLPDGQGDQVIKTRLAANEFPDIQFFYSGANLKQISPEKYFLDLSSESWTNNMLDVVKKVLTVDGKIIGAPDRGVSSSGVFYNKKVFNDLKLEIPKTWKELLAICDKVKAAGKVPVFYSFKDDWSAQLLTLESWFYVEQKNPDAASLLNTNKLKLADTPEYVSSFKKLSELREKGYINKDYLSSTYDNAQKALSNGDAAMYIMGSWITDPLSTNYPDKINDIGAFALPYDEEGVNGAVVFAPGGIYIPKSGKNIEAAKKWLAFFCSNEGQGAFYKAQKVTGTASFKGVDVGDTYDCIKDLIKISESGKVAMALEYQIDMSVSNDLPKICVDAGVGAKTPEQAAKAIDATLSKSAKAKGLAGW